jgi:hypothetical protein
VQLGPAGFERRKLSLRLGVQPALIDASHLRPALGVAIGHAHHLWRLPADGQPRS